MLEREYSITNNYVLANALPLFITDLNELRATSISFHFFKYIDWWQQLSAVLTLSYCPPRNSPLWLRSFYLCGRLGIEKSSPRRAFPRTGFGSSHKFCKYFCIPPRWNRVYAFLMDSISPRTIRFIQDLKNLIPLDPDLQFGDSSIRHGDRLRDPATRTDRTHPVIIASIWTSPMLQSVHDELMTIKVR